MKPLIRLLMLAAGLLALTTFLRDLATHQAELELQQERRLLQQLNDQAAKDVIQAQQLLEAP